MKGQLLLADGTAAAASAEAIDSALAGSQAFWLDLTGVDDETVGILADRFKIHPLALADVRRFSQRPKLEAYEGFVQLVMYGAAPGGDGTLEVHAFCAEKYLVTVHAGDSGVFDALRSRAAALPQHGETSAVLLLYEVVSTLVDSFFPVLDRFDDDIDKMEDDILKSPTDEQLGKLFDMKRTLVGLRKIITPERDVFAGVAAGASDLPGMTEDAARYFRDVYDHLIRLSDLVDSYRDLLTGAVDTHLSVVSNRLNVVMKQLAVIATIFLPLSFLTGFFGQNFSFLTDNITGTGVFLGAGIGLEILAVVGLVILFKRRGWLER